MTRRGNPACASWSTLWGQRVSNFWMRTETSRIACPSRYRLAKHCLAIRPDRQTMPASRVSFHTPEQNDHAISPLPRPPRHACTRAGPEARDTDRLFRPDGAHPDRLTDPEWDARERPEVLHKEEHETREACRAAARGECRLGARDRKPARIC